jgi:hypothetical protein
MDLKLKLSIFCRLITASAVILGFASSAAIAQQADPSIVVTLKGEGVPVVVVGVPGACFETTLFDTQTGRAIGTGIDCIDIVDFDGVSSFSVNRTTVFNFPQGQLIANGLTSVVPVFGDSSPESTHIVGDVDDSTQNIVDGTSAFAQRTGNVRLSGAVNLANFPNTVGFNCIFVITLD